MNEQMNKLVKKSTVDENKKRSMDTVEPLLTDPPRSGQPPSNGHTQKHRLILACKTNLREATASFLRTTDTGKVQTSIVQYKITSK